MQVNQLRSNRLNRHAIVLLKPFRRSGAILFMEPSNDHEVAIARVVDQISIEGRLSPSSIPEVAAALDFMMSRTDSEFLVNYMRWRMENSIAK